MARIYHKCHFCGGKVREKKVTVDYRWEEDLITVFKNVPAGACQVCGEQYDKAEIVPPFLFCWLTVTPMLIPS